MDIVNLPNYRNYALGSAELVDVMYKHIGSDTKKTLRKMIPLSGDAISSKCEDGISYVTKKMNGELAVVIYEDGICVVVNANDMAKAKLPTLEEAAEKLKKANITKAIFIAELYAIVDGVDKVSYVSNALSNDTSKLNLAFFDILEIDGNRPNGDYGVIHAELNRVFGTSGTSHSVWMKKVSGKQEISDIFKTLCLDANAEGLVVRSASSIVYKIKPKHSLDCVIVGYTSADNEHIRNLLIALMDNNDRYHVIGKLGVGLDESLSRNLYSQLSASTCQSSYVDADGSKLGFRFVKPELVLEISVNDINNENLEGTISNPLLSFGGDYSLERFVAGISLTHSVIDRIRDDKKANKDEVSISQINDFIATDPESDNVELSNSTLVVRDVYVKTTKDKTAVQKFMVFQTNKSDNKNFLSYMFFYTDFSEGRKDPLKTEIRVSDSKDQIMEIYKSYVSDNVKKGWNLIEN